MPEGEANANGSCLNKESIHESEATCPNISRCRLERQLWSLPDVEGEESSVPPGENELADQADSPTARSRSASGSDNSIGEPTVAACADSEGNTTEPYPRSNEEDVGFPAEALGDLPSIGSVGHFTGECRPCYFMNRKKCKAGADCTHCHYPHMVAKRPGKNHRKPGKKTQSRSGRDPDEAISSEAYLDCTVNSAEALHLAAPGDFLYSVTPYDPTLQGYQQAVQPAAREIRSWTPSEDAFPQRSHPDQRVGVLLSL